MNLRRYWNDTTRWLLGIVLSILLGQFLTASVNLAYNLLSGHAIMITNPVPGVVGIIAIVSLAIIIFYFALRWKGYLKGSKETTIDVYKRNSILLTDYLHKAKHEIYILGVTLEETSRLKNTIRNIVKSNVKTIRILICNPNSPIITQIVNLVGTNIQTIDASIQSLQELKTDPDLSREQANKLEIRLYDEIPVQSLFIIDPKQDWAMIRFEPYVFGIIKEERRIHQITMRIQADIFTMYLKSYEKLWGLAKPL